MLDSLYFQCKIIGQLCDYNKLKNFLTANKINFDKVAKGYFYLIEISMNHLINCIEWEIKDEKLYQLIHWGGILLKDIPDKIKKNNQDLKFIIQLEELRNGLKNIRMNGSGDFDKNLIGIAKLSNSISEYYLKTLKYKINSENKANEDNFFIFELINKQNHIKVDADFDFETKKFKRETGLYPFCSWYYLITNEIYSAYHLHNKAIIKDNKIYLNGYSTGLSFIYSQAGLNKNLVNMILKSSSWGDLNRKGSILYNEIIEKKKLNLIGKDIFEEKNFWKLKKFNKKTISDKKELSFVLENRPIKVAGVDERFDLPLIYSILLGKTQLNDKTQVIEFLVNDKNGDKRFHYAIYMFQGTSLSNGSYWYLLKDVAIENDWEPFSNEKAQVMGVINAYKNSFSFCKYRISEELLENYLVEKDPNYRDMVFIKTRLKDSNSLLVELLSLYLQVKENSNILDINWGVETSGKNKTDIDGLLISKDKKIKIIQAQTTFYKNEKELENHFNKCVNHLKYYLKKKRLGKVKDYIIKKEVLVLFDSEGYNLKKDKKKIDYLKNKNIEVRFLESEINRNPNLLEKPVKNKIFKLFERINDDGE